MTAPMASRPRMCRSTGREPMAQPPGKATSASPKRATIGPSTRIDARMVFTSSYGAIRVLMVRGSISTASFSSITGSMPMRPNSSIMVVMSCRCGRLATVTGPSHSRVAARIGRAEFFAPEMRISPSRRAPPVIINLSIRISTPVGSGALGPGRAAEKFHSDRMDAAIGDPWVQMGIDLLLTLHRAQRRQFSANHVQLEIAAFALDFYLRSGQLSFKKALHFVGLHAQPQSAPCARGSDIIQKSPAPANPGKQDSDGGLLYRCGLGMRQQLGQFTDLSDFAHVFWHPADAQRLAGRLGISHETQQQRQTDAGGFLSGFLGLGDFPGPTIDGFVQVVAIALHRISELITEQLANVDTVDDDVAQLPLAADLFQS